MGRTNLAQTLGFFWGLSLDVYGMSLFGAQGGLLTVVGYVSGRFSRQLNADKLGTQEVIVFLGTVFFVFGLYSLDVFFRGSGRPLFSVGPVLGEFLLNAIAAPLVFWVMGKWAEVWSLRLVDE
jgi:rod shape-determining protein MreD